MQPQQRAIRFVSLLIGTACIAVPFEGAELTFEERVEAHLAIQAVYHEHRIGEKRPFEQAVPRETVERRVRWCLDQPFEFSREQFDRELDRIQSSSRLPERLRQVFEALDNDPLLIRESLVRPILIDRAAVARTVDPTARATLARFHEQFDRASVPEGVEVERIEFTLRHDIEDARTRFPTVAEHPGPLNETEHRLSFAVVETDMPRRFVVGIYSVATRPLASSIEELLPRQIHQLDDANCPEIEQWQPTSLINVPEGRYLPTMVWTGSEAIVWGGIVSQRHLDTGARYDPMLDLWFPTTTDGAPAPRRGHTAVWTGTEMIVWGGRDWSSERFNSGGRYDPVLDSWTPTSTSGAPSAREAHSAVWTGSKMIVFGGHSGGLCDVTMRSGSEYTPATDSWLAIPSLAPGSLESRSDHTAVWTGSMMIVFGGLNANIIDEYQMECEYRELNTGSRYDAATRQWKPLGSGTPPAARFKHTAVWTGSQMVVWGGGVAGFDLPGPISVLDDGARYRPNSGEWYPTSPASVPSARYDHTAVWSGREMFVWGGNLIGTRLSDGARYDPLKDSWVALTNVGAPSGRSDHAAVWADTEMVVWGGLPVTITGGRHQPARPDFDADDLCSNEDNCPATFNPDQADTDSDGVGDACDPCPDDPHDDPDLDGVCVLVDNCPGTGNPNQSDVDSDGLGDLCDNCFDRWNADQLDTDLDGVGDACDLCPLAFDPSQLDLDGDQVGDVCDNCGAIPNEFQYNLDGDAYGNACDLCPDQLLERKISADDVVPAGVEQFVISPDDTRVAYLARTATNPNLGLYSVSLAGPPAVALSPVPSAAADVSQFAFTPDSATVLFTADIEAPGTTELYAVPASGGTAIKLNDAAVAGALGITFCTSTDPCFHIAPGGARVLYSADLDGSGTRHLYSAEINGGGQDQLDPRTSPGAAFSDVTSDGQYVLYTSSISGLTELYRVAITGSGPTRKINDPISGVFGGGLATARYAPDDSYIVYSVVAENQTTRELFVADPAGQGPVQQVSGPMAAPGGVIYYEFSPDGQWIVYRAPQDSASSNELYRVRPDGSQQAKLNGPLVDGGNVVWNGWAINSTGDHVVYRADANRSGVVELFSVDIATLAVTQLHRPLLSYEDVDYFVISPDGTRVAYSGGLVSTANEQLWAVDLDGSDEIQLDGPYVGSIHRSYVFTPDSSKVVYNIRPGGGTSQLFVASATTGAISERLVAPPQASSGVAEFAITADGSVAVYRSDELDPSTIELFTAPVGPDSDADLVVDTCDCAPGDAGIFTGAVGEVSIVAFGADGTLTWTDTSSEFGSGTGYDVMSGLVTELPVGGPSESCEENRVVGTQTIITDAPPPGGAAYMLVRPANDCGAGSYGFDSAGLERSSLICP